MNFIAQQLQVAHELMKVALMEIRQLSNHNVNEFERNVNEIAGFDATHSVTLEVPGIDRLREVRRAFEITKKRFYEAIRFTQNVIAAFELNNIELERVRRGISLLQKSTGEEPDSLIEGGVSYDLQHRIPIDTDIILAWESILAKKKEDKQREEEEEEKQGKKKDKKKEEEERKREEEEKFIYVENRDDYDNPQYRMSLTEMAINIQKILISLDMSYYSSFLNIQNLLFYYENIESYDNSPVIIEYVEILKTTNPKIWKSLLSINFEKDEKYESIVDLLSEIFEEKIADRSLGTSDTDFFGPVISDHAAYSIRDYTSKMANLGNEIKQYGKNRDSNIQIIQATAIICKSQNALNGIEIFGPVIRFERFQNRGEAIDLANNNEYGLTSAVWTEDFSEFTYFSEQLKFGVVNFNGPTHGAEFQFPFGGTRNSGNGAKEVGLGSLAEYSDTKLISITNHD